MQHSKVRPWYQHQHHRHHNNHEHQQSDKNNKNHYNYNNNCYNNHYNTNTISSGKGLIPILEVLSSLNIHGSLCISTSQINLTRLCFSFFFKFCFVPQSREHFMTPYTRRSMARTMRMSAAGAGDYLPYSVGSSVSSFLSAWLPPWFSLSSSFSEVSRQKKI